MQYPKITERHDLVKVIKVGDTLAKRTYIVGSRCNSVDLIPVEEIDGLVVVSGGKRHLLQDSDSPHSGYSWRKATEEDYQLSEEALRETLISRIQKVDLTTIETSTLEVIVELLK